MHVLRERRDRRMLTLASRAFGVIARNSCGGEGGIRTPVARRASGLQPDAIDRSATSPKCRAKYSKEATLAQERIAFWADVGFTAREPDGRNQGSPPRLHSPRSPPRGLGRVLTRAG